MSVFSLIYEVKQHSQHTTTSTMHNLDLNLEFKEVASQIIPDILVKDQSLLFQKATWEVERLTTEGCYTYSMKHLTKCSIHNSPCKNMLVPAFFI